MSDVRSTDLQLSHWRVFVNGTAYMGMGEVNADGSAGPNLRAAPSARRSRNSSREASGA
jgi:hypothetical protein